MEEARKEANQQQPADAKCPSNNPLGIQCTCVDAGVSRKLNPSYGPNLVLSSSGLLFHWLRHAKHLDTAAHAFDWVVRQAHGDPKWKHQAPKLVTVHRSLLQKSQKRPYFSERNDRSNVICFSTSLSYLGQIDKVMSKYTPAQPKLGRKPAVQEQWAVSDGVAYWWTKYTSKTTPMPERLSGYK